MSKKFRKKYVLGEGYPWAMGTKRCKEIALCKQATGVDFVLFDFPTELWTKEVPKYRLVLERVDDKTI